MTYAICHLKMGRLNYYYSCPKNAILFSAVMRPNNADGKENSKDPDQTAPMRSSLIWAFSVFSDLYVF